MTGHLSVVCQGSGESEEVPTDWKLTNSIQIYKKGLRKDPGTYRPVRLTSVDGKIVEIDGKILCSVERHLKTMNHQAQSA